MSESDLDEKFAALRREYAAEVPAKVDAIAAAIGDAERAGTPDEVARATSLAHRLAGTAGAYGLPDIGASASAVEDSLREVSIAGWQRVHEAMAALALATRSAPRS